MWRSRFCARIIPDTLSLKIIFGNEARAVANLSHPNIVAVYDFGNDNGQLFIVMELVPVRI